jgi:2-dehydro-3-deoxyglucarate aldolase/4-hydroxy-2-oxoheptanedioate aldolase
VSVEGGAAPARARRFLFAYRQGRRSPTSAIVAAVRSAEAELRGNPVKQKLAAGGTAFGAMVFEFLSPGLPQIARNAGAEFLLYDMEHTGLGFETLKTQFALCRGLDVVPLVRVPRGEYAFIARALDVGAFGVMAPMVGTADEARAIVACTRYPPAGRRGAAFGFAHDDYESGDLATKIAALNERTLVIVQIETDEGLSNVDAIAAVPGVDVLWIGQFDLTNFLGIPGDFAHSRFIAALDRILLACASRGIAPAILATDDASIRAFAQRGFRAMAYGVDHLLLQDAMRSGMERMRAACRRNER